LQVKTAIYACAWSTDPGPDSGARVKGDIASEGFDRVASLIRNLDLFQRAIGGGLWSARRHSTRNDRHDTDALSRTIEPSRSSETSLTSLEQRETGNIRGA
jgi:hypothetical protein